MIDKDKMYEYDAGQVRDRLMREVSVRSSYYWDVKEFVIGKRFTFLGLTMKKLVAVHRESPTGDLSHAVLASLKNAETKGPK